MPKSKNSLKKKKPTTKRKASKKTFIKPVETPNIDYTERYKCHENYKLLCARTHAGSYGKCCVCLTSKGVEIHHSRYLGVKDTIGKNIFSTCVRCHNIYCHNSTNWFKSKTDPLWGNHNTIEFEKRLQNGYKILNQQGISSEATTSGATRTNKPKTYARSAL